MISKLLKTLVTTFSVTIPESNAGISKRHKDIGIWLHGVRQKYFKQGWLYCGINVSRGRDLFLQRAADHKCTQTPEASEISDGI